MANMSYCMFTNTLQDLRECRNILREAGSLEELAARESKPAVQPHSVLQDY